MVRVLVRRRCPSECRTGVSCWMRSGPLTPFPSGIGWTIGAAAERRSCAGMGGGDHGVVVLPVPGHVNELPRDVSRTHSLMKWVTLNESATLGRSGRLDPGRRHRCQDTRPACGSRIETGRDGSDPVVSVGLPPECAGTPRCRSQPLAIGRGGGAVLAYAQAAATLPRVADGEAAAQPVGARRPRRMPGGSRTRAAARSWAQG